MKEIKFKLLIDAVKIQMQRDKITAEEVIAKYPTLSDTEKAALIAVFQ